MEWPVNISWVGKELDHLRNRKKENVVNHTIDQSEDLGLPWENKKRLTVFVCLFVF